MSKSRNLSDLLDANGDVVSGALDNVPPSNDASALTTGTLPVDRVPYLGRRNLLINGAMQVAQRGTSTTGQTGLDGYYVCDRWKSQTDTGTWTLSQDTDAPNGFAKSYKFQCTTAGTSNADEIAIKQYLEGQDLQQLAYGTSDAKSLTLSFWIKCNQTGNFEILLQNSNSAGTRFITKQLTIDAADTWEYKTVTFEGDTDTGFENGNTRELDIQWTFGAASAWTSGTASRAWADYAQADFYDSSIMGLGGSTSDYFNITGVQLEVGSVATPFEHRSYGEELALCQRYYYRITGDSGHPIGFGYFYTNDYSRTKVHFPVTMRAKPTLSATNSSQAFRILSNGSSSRWTDTFSLSNQTNLEYATINDTSTISSPGTAGFGLDYQIYISGSYVAFDAEL